MKVLTVIGGALATAVVAGGLLVGPAFAAAPAQPPNGCGAALLALSNAEKAAADAVAADNAAADAKKADDALANANAAVDAARADAVNSGVSSANLTATGAQALRDDKAAIEAKPVAQRTPAEVDRLIVDNKQLPLVEAFLDAQTKAAAAKVVADKTDADALRREADKTDAAALGDAAAKAGTAADRACGNSGNVRFENCDQVRAAGKAPLRFDQPGYRVGLDANRNGFACEAVENTVTPRLSTVPRVTGIDTGLV